MFKRLRRLYWEWRAFRKWQRHVGVLVPPQDTAWEDGDGRRLTGFFQEQTGRRLRRKIKAQEHQMDADAVRAHTDLTYACGYAAGARGMSAWIMTLAHAPDSPPDTTTTADPDEWGEEELRERLTP